MKSNKSKRAKAKEQKSKRAKAKEQILNPATKTTNKAKGIQKTWLSKPAKQTKRHIQTDPKQKLAIQKRKSSKPPNQAKPSKQTTKPGHRLIYFPYFKKQSRFRATPTDVTSLWHTVIRNHLQIIMFKLQ